jgi:hypothetical protein
MSLEPTPAGQPALQVPHPIVQLARLLTAGSAAFRTTAPEGYQRGIDIYSAAVLPMILAKSARQFRAAHGRFPDIIEPVRYTDKIYWSKFFRPLKIPETGNKLMTASFIPDEAKDLVQCPRIVWHSSEARVPRGKEIEPGAYFLKVNFGSDRFRRVTSPLTDAEADALDAEFAAHLDNDYNWWRGEWWYNIFPRELLLEQAIGSGEETTSWNFLVIGGEIARATVYQKLADGSARKAHLSPDFKPLPAFDDSEPAEFELPSSETLERLAAAAKAIGTPLRFVRVDFLLDDDETIYLGEVTFTPGHGTLPMRDDMDLELGALWDLSGELP